MAHLVCPPTHRKLLTLKVLSQIVADIFMFSYYYHFPEKIRLGISCESFAKQMSSFTFSEKYNEKIKMSAAVGTCA